jgi:hypothetical protein
MKETIVGVLNNHEELTGAPSSQVHAMAEPGRYPRDAALDIHEFRDQATAAGAWHLFYIEAEANPLPFESTLKGYLISSHGESRQAAEMLACAVVRDTLPEGVADPVGVGVDSCSYVGIVDRDVWRELGEIRR